jgi:hypothetical protein
MPTLQGRTGVRATTVLEFGLDWIARHERGRLEFGSEFVRSSR